MINEKKVIADAFIVVDYATYIPVDVFSSLDAALDALNALEKSFSNINYGVVILDKGGNDITMEYWKEVYYSGR